MRARNLPSSAVLQGGHQVTRHVQDGGSVATQRVGSRCLVLKPGHSGLRGRPEDRSADDEADHANGVLDQRLERAFPFRVGEEFPQQCDELPCWLELGRSESRLGSLAQDEQGHRGSLGQVVRPSHDGRLDPALQGHVASECLAQAGEQRVADIGGHRVVESRFATEVVKDSLSAEPDLGGHVLESCAREPLFREESLCDLENPLPGALSGCYAARRSPRGMNPTRRKGRAESLDTYW